MNKAEKDIVKFEAIAARHTPTGVRVIYRRTLSGYCNFERRTMSVPPPVTRDQLYVYLHECGHWHLNHLGGSNDDGKSWAEVEFEAERWAQAIMRIEGIAVPKLMLKDAKRYVRQMAAVDKKNGKDIVKPHIDRWSRR